MKSNAVKEYNKARKIDELGLNFNTVKKNFKFNICKTYSISFPKSIQHMYANLRKLSFDRRQKRYLE